MSTRQLVVLLVGVFFNTHIAQLDMALANRVYRHSDRQITYHSPGPIRGEQNFKTNVKPDEDEQATNGS